MFEALVSGIDETLQDGPSERPSGESIGVWQRQRNRCDYAMAAEVAGFDRDQVWSVDGAYNAASWLSTTCRIPRREAHTLVRVGRALREMPAVAGAWAAGDIGIEHANQLASARRPATAEAFARDEAWLVGQARALAFHQFRCVVRTWADHADPDAAEARAKRAFDARRVRTSQSLDDEWFLDARLDPIGGLIVADELRRLERKMFRADWKAAKKRLGRKPLLDELERTPDQRRADAIVAMASRSASRPKGARQPEPLFTVVLGQPEFERMCELHNRTLTTPGSCVRWLSKAWVERVVFDSASRPIDVGRKRRLFSSAQRRAVQVRDRRCEHEKCERPAVECETDHVLPYAEGGETTEANGRALCRFHNQLRNRKRGGPAPPVGPAP